MSKRFLAAARRAVTSFGTAFLDCLLPQSCAICRHRIHSGQKLCDDCSALVKPAPVHFCPLCRFEGHDSVSEGGLAAACPAHGRVLARAALPTQEHILALVHRFKYSGEQDLAGLLAGLILDSGIVDAELRSFDVMCPVPLHRSRLRERGFNQSAEVGNHIQDRTGVPLAGGLLRKTRATPEQAKLGAEARRRNLASCFEVTMPALVRGKDVLLVDDVMTTGSTAAGCVEALLSAGAHRVAVIVASA